MSAVRKDCPSEKSAIARAIEIAGGPNALASTTGFAPSAVKRWLTAGMVDSPAAAAAIEEASSVSVEELMPDTCWLRAHDGELLGVATPLNGADANYIRMRLATPVKPDGELIEGKYDADGYIAGMTRGLTEEQRAENMKLYYRLRAMDGHWSKDRLDELRRTVEEDTVDFFLHEINGICHSLDDKEREALLQKHGVYSHDRVPRDVRDAIVAEVTARRANTTAPVYALDRLGDAEWGAILIRLGYEIHIPADRLYRISYAAEYLSETVTSGIQAVGDLLTVAMAPGSIDLLQNLTIRNAVQLMRDLTELDGYLRSIEHCADSQLNRIRDGNK